METLDPWIEAALQAGAKLHCREEDNLWVVLDQSDNDLWQTFFSSRIVAARAFCRQYGITPEGI